MKHIIIFILLFLGVFKTYAQINFNEINNQHNSNSASKYLPSLLGDDSYKFEITLFNAFATAGNSFVSLYDINHIADSVNENLVHFDELLAKTRKRNSIFAATDLDILNTSIRLRTNEQSSFVLGFGIRQRNEFQFTFDKNLLALAYQGNSQFAGQDISLFPSINYLSLLDYHVSGAYSFRDEGLGGKEWKIACALHRYIGISNVQTQHSNISMFTNEDGRYIDVTTDLDVHVAPGVDSAYLNNTEFNESTIKNFVIKGHGNGWGIDFGATLKMNENIDLKASIIDFGGIKFNSNSLNYTRSSSIRYEGVDLEGVINPIVTSNFEADSLINFLQLSESKGNYSVAMPTKFLINAEWHSNAEESQKVLFSKHTFNATYLQGLGHYLSSNPYPCLNFGYTFSLKNILNFGINSTIGGMYGGFQTGGLISLRARLIKISFGSNNLLPIFSERMARASDGYVSASILF